MRDSAGPLGASAWIEVDTDAITANVTRLNEVAGSADVMAVMKADAYGHGLVPSARAALAGGATWLGVAQLAEAHALRAAGITAPILTWIFPPGADLQAAIAADLDISVGSAWSLDAVEHAARAAGRPARVHLKIDTGLGRGGSLLDARDLADRMAGFVAEGVLTLVGVWSHFAWADAPHHPTVRLQQERFIETADYVEKVVGTGFLRHLANSAATLTNPSAHFDLVRPGLAVYGLSPVPDLGRPEDYGLREAMSVRARLTLVKAAPAGQGVSYGHEYVTPQATNLGLVPMGYADGIPRSASGRGPIEAGGQRYQVAGRVCMDQVMLDLGPESTLTAGDEVILLGAGVDGHPTAQEWAEAADTINYEIVTRMGPRLPRVYRGGEHG